MAETDLSGKTALVTGSTRRIGRAIALSLAREGVHLVLHYRSSAAETARLAATVKKFGVRAWTLPADFQKRGESETLVERAIERAGKLDILINNASRFIQDSAAGLTLEGLTADIRVNAWVPYYLSRELARTSKKGSVVHLLDTRVVGVDRAHVSYSLSKRMLAEFTSLCALEFAPAVRVNAVAPGAILPPPGKNRPFLEKLGRGLPLRRHGDPQDVAAAVLFLLRNPFVTGQVIFVDGGRHLREGQNG